MPIKCQSIANLMPILYWSDVNPRPIQCKCIANLVPIWCQSGANPMSIWTQYCANFPSNVDSLPICQSTPNPTPIQCQSCVNPMPFKSYQFSSTIQSIPNPMSIQCPSPAKPAPVLHQSFTNPAPIWCLPNGANLVSIHCQSNVNQKPIGCQSSSPGHHFIANPLQM